MLYNIIVAHDIRHGIGLCGGLPWTISDDLKRFRQLTTQSRCNCVVMGRKTWESLPEKYKPLPNRINIVLSSTLESESFHGATICRSLDELDNLIETISIRQNLDEVFFIGGNKLFKAVQNRYTINRYYLTQIFKDYECDVQIDPINTSRYKLVESQLGSYQESHNNQVEIVNYRFQTYELEKFLSIDEKSQEQPYLDLLNYILKNGKYRSDRTGVGTLSVFEGCQLKFDLTHGFPLLTTKWVYWTGIFEELLFIIKGLTNVIYLQDKNVHIWDENCSREYLDSIGQHHRKVGDLGKFYGFQWRHFGADYIDCDHDYTGKGFDQLADVIRQIRTNPVSRRILISAWNPNDLKETCLPPCHVLYQFYVDIDNRQLSCHMYQRSADMFLGVPFNIGSTALLTTLIAKSCDLQPYKVIISYGDAHIYINHIQPVIEQVANKPYRFPQLSISEKKENVEDYLFSDMILSNYVSHKKIKAKMAV
jgi:dihydrofolate reductase/thymidylate synthase